MMTGILNVSNVLPLYWILTLVFLLLFAIYDYRHHKIRNPALAAFFVWCLLYIPVRTLADPSVHWIDLTFHAILGSMAAFLSLLFIYFLSNEGIGGGDIKLVTILAIPLGTAGILGMLLVSCLAALLHVWIQKILQKKTMESIAYAPYVALGVLVYVLPQIMI